MIAMKPLLATTLLMSMLPVEFALADTPVITSQAKSTADRPVSEQTVSDPRIAAEQFVQHVNYARVSLALKDPAQAKSHISTARTLVAVMKSASADQRHATHVESGRITYKNESGSNYYFPIETGAVDIKKVSTGPFWAENKGAAVTDAEVVYLTLNFSGDNAEKDLDQATQSIDKGDYAAAQSYLNDVMSDTVKEENATSIPIEKARDNLALAHSFIGRRNYDGARYALGHARDALDAMDNDNRYNDRKERIVAMRQEVTHMQNDISKNDPTVLEKADATIQQWWNDLKD